ncbi:MAG: alpha-amylase family glycosyl hydrolase [Bythopirellula sp.]
MQTVSFDLSQIQNRLERLYADRAQEAAAAILAAIERVNLQAPDSDRTELWNQRDVVLITYGDQVRSDSLNPLQTFHRFLADWNLPPLINTVHFLPCFPYTSDDGFSVVDYRSVDPELGTWNDVHAIGADCHLMLDLVLNHISQQSEWFQKYLAGASPYDKFFIEADPAEDLSAVTRPRSLPLLSDFDTSRGKRWLWTTFSRDQVDLNYAEPALLAEMIGILLEYVAHGARIIRLDAIAYLWKRLGTSCIHLAETHEVVKLMRDVLDQLAPQALLLTETNVPHEENVSYFGAGDEAHMIYQFSLPPLLLDAFLNDDALPLKRWLKDLENPPPGTTYFNFTASHDGIGVRPLEGHVAADRLQRIVDQVEEQGGAIGTRTESSGEDSPYELNVSYLSALKPKNGDQQDHARRFLTTQAVMLALQGVPAIYFHSLVGTENDLEGMRESGIPRRINRRKFEVSELNEQLHADGALPQLVFQGVQALLRVRIAQAAFHPDAEQRYWESDSDQVLCFERECGRTGQTIFVAANFSDEATVIELPESFSDKVDLLSGERVGQAGTLLLAPAQTVWLELRPSTDQGN